MAIFEFVLIFLAAGALVNAWMMRDGLFAGARSWLEAWGDPSGHNTLGDAVRWFIASLLTCRVCLTYHTAFWLIVIFWLPGLFLAPPWVYIWFTPVYALAATRVSLLLGTLSISLDVENDPEAD